jgi:hypothetical protein
MRVKALQSIYYNRQMRAVGDEYDMDAREEQSAKLLALLGKIKILEQQAREQIKPAPVEPPPEEQHHQRDTEGKRTYRRRDMRVER